jgi:hypothetical protein
MRDRLALAAVLWACLAGAALAGAWPREPGGVFLSQRFDYDRSWREQEVSAAIYAEYGLTRRLTLIGQLSNEDEAFTVSRSGVALNVALGPLDAANRFAVSLGVSTPPSVMGVMTERRIETGLYWGRGFESRWGGGWATATAKALFARDEEDPITDLSALVGVRPRDGWMAMLSTSRYRDAGGIYTKVTSSLGYEVRDRLWLVPSVTQEVTDDRSTGVGVAVWFSF